MAMAAAPLRPAASTVRRATSCMALLLACVWGHGWRWQRGPPLGRVGNACDLGQHAGRREDLREHGRLALAGIKQIERHAAAAVLLEEAGDLGIAARPVPLEIGDALGGERCRYCRACQRRAFVDEAGDAPCRAEVDEHRATGGEQRIEPRLRERLLDG